jgi:hypothetical protein
MTSSITPPLSSSSEYFALPTFIVEIRRRARSRERGGAGPVT